MYLIPPHCILCGTSTTNQYDLCHACKDELPWMTHYCQQCALPLPTSQFRCGNCLKHPPYFDKTLALFHYQPPLTKLIPDYKFHDKLVYGKIFSELLLEKLYHRSELPQALIPVPLHSKRLQERGYNQALELAKPLAKRLRLPLLCNICQRHKATAAQSNLPANKRQTNVKNAFSLKKSIPYTHIAMIDDVITTGNTVNELSRLLKQNNVHMIEIWC